MIVPFSSTGKPITGILLLSLMFALGATGFGQDSQASPERWSLAVGDKAITGMGSDWTFHNSVYSDPGTEEQAIAAGRHEHWLKIVNSPRYLTQQLRRREPARGPYANQIAEIEARMKAHEPAQPKANRDRAGEPSPEVNRESEPDILDKIQAELWRRDLPRVSLTAPLARAREEGEGHDDSRSFQEQILATPSGRRSNLMPPDPSTVRAERKENTNTDWSIGNAVAATGAYKILPNSYPVGWGSGTTANCATDFTAYPTGNYGSATQATIVAYNNRYSGCTGTVPNTYWAYNTGSGAIAGAPVINVFNQNELAFTQYSSAAGNASSLVLLKWASGMGTLTAPATPASVAASAFSTCTAPCMVSLALDHGKLDYYSNPFYDYGSDTIYVGDNGGYLHKFTPVFNGTPAEVTTGSWPLLLNSGVDITSPVLDEGTGYIFVGDINGYVYAITPAGSVTKALWGYYDDYGVFDAPLIDNTALAQYFFVTSYYTCNPVTAVCTEYNAVIGFNPSTGFSCPPCTATPLAALVGITGYPAATNTTSGQLWAGAFDDTYFTSSNSMSPSGHLYVMGNTDGYKAFLNYSDALPGSALYQVSITNNVVTGNTAGNAYGYNGEEYGNNGPLTEYYNANAGEDYLFVSTETTQDYHAYEYIPNCFSPGNCSTGYGCVMSFNANAFSATQAALGEAPFCSYENAPATGGFLIDNDVSSGVLAGASQVYFNATWTTYNAGYPGSACSSSGQIYGPCAVQAPQAGP